MICIKVSVPTFDNRIFYQCPKCKSTQIFFTYSPVLCSNCKCLLPDANELITDKAVRYNYHAKGVED